MDLTKLTGNFDKMGVLENQVRLLDEEFQALRMEYNLENDQYYRKLIYRVGGDAGFFSELGTMFYCIMFCHVYHIKFMLYADYANFQNNMGWEEFFKPFCEERHFIINRWGNNRGLKSYTTNNPLRAMLKKQILPAVIKKIEKVDYLSFEYFDIFSDYKYLKNHYIKWELMGIEGNMTHEMAKIGKLAFQFKDDVWDEIQDKIDSLSLPEQYISVQLRGGDKQIETGKNIELSDLYNAIEKSGVNVNNVFVFTDDYRYIKKLEIERPNWSLYTLTRPDEKGYNNDIFMKMKWADKRSDYIKLFAMVNICLLSEVHFGDNATSVNAYIESSRIVRNKKFYRMR